MANKKNALIHVVSLSVLCIGFVLCRYAFFGLHGMKQWPELLFGVGLVSLTISFFLNGKTTPIFTSFAYIVGFAAGIVFETDGVDAGGAGTNNLWIIWTVVFLCLILVGVISERSIRSNQGPHK